MMYIIINDNEAGFAAAELTPEISDNVHVGVVIDQVVPANSPEISMRQRKLMDWAHEHGYPYAYGRAMTGAVVQGDDSVSFGWNIKKGDVVIGTTKEIQYAGNVGAEGICVSKEEFLETLLNRKSWEFSSSSEPGDEDKKDQWEPALVGSPISCVYIGGMGAFLADLKAAAEVLRGRQIARGVRLVVSPVSAEVYCEAADAGYLIDFMNAGGIVLNQCAAPAVQARIGNHELMVSSDIYDETGLAGPESSKILLVSAKEAAKMALTGVVGWEA